MGEWQRDELAGEDDIVYLTAMTENCGGAPASASELEPWQAELNFESVLLTDPAREIYNAYAEANDCQMGGGPGGPGCSNAVTVLIDKNMVVRYFGRTYECGTGDGSTCGGPANIPPETAQCLDAALTDIQSLLSE